MAEFLLGAAAFVLGTVALGLLRVLRGPADADRLLAAPLLGTGGVATLLLFGVATGEAAAGDLALVLTLLAAFAAVGFATGLARPGRCAPGGQSGATDSGPAGPGGPAGRAPE